MNHRKTGLEVLRAYGILERIMAIPDLIGLLGLSRVVFSETRRYFNALPGKKRVVEQE